VWKTIGAPVLNVSNRYGAWHYGRQRMLAINNVELISDRPIEINLREIAEVKRAWPDRASSSPPWSRLSLKLGGRLLNASKIRVRTASN